MKRLLIAAMLLAALPTAVQAARAPRDPGEPLGIALEGFDYPFPVHLFPLEWKDGAASHAVRLAYMDVAPTGKANGHVALLLHGRNFPASYWEGVIRALTAEGWRVIAPDQIGFGKSSKPEGEWRFDVAASNTIALLDKLGIQQVDLIGHSMGGMLATRFAVMHPDRVRKLVLEAPLGMEDYRKYVPEVPRSQQMTLESGLTEEAYMFYLTNTYRPTLTREQLQPFVDVRERMKGSAEYPRWVEAYVATFYAIQNQPVFDLFGKITLPTLFIVGSRDRTAPGRAYAKEADREKIGHVADLAVSQASHMQNAQVMTLDTGHLVHLEQPDVFDKAVIGFLK